jgi:TolB-like protein/Tfp pilus assembly protein PilF/predicted Ser/Thr protein kinase
MRGTEPGSSLGNYRIERLLGRGGMGAVFLAYDTTLHRHVALKLVGAASAEQARGRLLREARSAAALNHPGICTIHEVGEADGSAFIAMEYVDGQPLNDRIAGGPLAIEDVLRFGVQAADALAFAHDRGVVHRDFKSANAIVSTTGRLKIVDFGLARREDVLVADATTIASLADRGVAIGTPYAMSPEQVKGEEAGAGSDIWALGVVLYEMAAGAKPFHGATGPELFSSILRDPPAPLPAAVPHALAPIIERCLEKDPARRYRSAADVRDALEAIDPGAAARRPRRPFWASRRAMLAAAASIGALALAAAFGRFSRIADSSVIKLAVLPFENPTGDQQEEYFSDGLTEDMITQLGRLHPRGLSVIARTSSMRYKKSNKSIEDIGRELGVDYLLEGSARREAGRVRINATLIQVRDQTQRWAESYERELAGIMTVQGEVAAGVARSLALALLPAEQTRLARARPINPDAYEDYVKGRSHENKLTRADLDTAQQYFERALTKDPSYALAYVGIAHVWSGRRQMGFVSPRVATPNAHAATLKAIELDDTLPEAHAALAGDKGYGEYDWTGAETEFRRALALNPNLPDARASYSHLLQSLRRPDEAFVQINRALEIDPLNPLYRAFYAVDLVFVRRYDEAIAQFREALRTSPNLPFAQTQLGNALHLKGLHGEALAVLRTQARGSGDDALDQALAQGSAEGGYLGAMRRAADMMAARAQATTAAEVRVASMYLRAGDPQRALDWLEKAYEYRDPNLYGIISPMWDDLRNDTRFVNLRRRMNLPL